jgi:hypothetical protein
MMKRLFLPFIFLFGISSQLVSQTLTSSGNQPVTGISKERITKINAMLDEAVASQQIP